MADSAKIVAAARTAIRAHQAGKGVVLVVSARGQTTDELIELAHEITEHPPAREMDMLLSTGEQISIALVAMAIGSLGHQAISFTGAQVGIVTDSFHTKARIKSISTERLRLALADGKIVIVAGFQGIDAEDNITTLGRGGSDTTAVALAAALGADECEIYTDVDGVYTTDPRVVPEARKVERISYDEMLELASAGAAVMHSRSIEFAKKFGVPIHVRSSFSDAEGTMIVPEADEDEPVVSGAALVRDEARVSIYGAPEDPSAPYLIFTRIAERNIPVDMIVRNVSTEGRAEISFTVERGELAEALRVSEEVAREIGAAGVTSDDNVAKVSVVGAGMRTHTGVAERMFAALAAEAINILMITTSDIKISVLVQRDRAADALRAVHRAFELDRPIATSARSGGAGAFRPKESATLREAAGAGSLASMVQQLASMEDIVVSDVVLDDSQGRVTIYGVPDRPGFAAKIFSRIAEGGIIVDMIVQDVSTEGTTHLSFTVPRAAVKGTVELAEAVMREIGAGGVSAEPEIAMLSVLGVGMRSHTGVAQKMFGALAERKIPISMINTSEVRITAVVERGQAQEALECLRKAFGMAGV